jgi:regulatory factor X, other
LAPLEPLEPAVMARMLQAENARQTTDSPLDSPIIQPGQQSHSPHDIQQQFPQPYYAQPSNMMYQQQSMEYAYQPVPQHAMAIKTEETKRPRVSTGHTNENELKEMLLKNMSRPLDQVADEVIANERTSSSEKSKQLFAMLWYVPRRCVDPANSPG